MGGLMGFYGDIIGWTNQTIWYGFVWKWSGDIRGSFSGGIEKWMVSAKMLVTGFFLEFRSERSLEILATNVKISGMVWLHGCLTSDPCTTQFPPQVPAVKVMTWRGSTRLSMSWTRTLMTACLRMRWPVALLQYEQGGGSRGGGLRLRLVWLQICSHVSFLLVLIVFLSNLLIFRWCAPHYIPKN